MSGLITNIKHVEKSWGWEDWICNSEKYCGKILHINKHKNCSFHYHLLKDEVLYVRTGMINFLYSDITCTEIKEIILKPGMGWHVEPKLVHQMFAIEETEILEFSTQHFDSDSHRITTDLVIAGSSLK